MIPQFEPFWFSIGVLTGVILGLIADGLHRAAKRKRELKEKRIPLPRRMQSAKTIPAPPKEKSAA